MQLAYTQPPKQHKVYIIRVTEWNDDQPLQSVVGLKKLNNIPWIALPSIESHHRKITAEQNMIGAPYSQFKIIGTTTSIFLQYYKTHKPNNPFTKANQTGITSLEIIESMVRVRRSTYWTCLSIWDWMLVLILRLKAVGFVALKSKN